jgi:hypothetical protein
MFRYGRPSTMPASRARKVLPTGPPLFASNVGLKDDASVLSWLQRLADKRPSGVADHAQGCGIAQSTYFVDRFG